MISFQFVAGQSVSGHAHAEIELLYVIHGTARVQTGGNEYLLQSDDYLMVNSGTIHAFSGSGDLLMGEFHIRPDQLSGILGRENLQFRCNSTLANTPEKYEPARKTMREIFSRYHNNQEQDTLQLYALYYRLLHQLTAGFLQVDPAAQAAASVQTDSRVSEITEYIRLNYSRPLRLSDLAEHLHLSDAYLSKYFKKTLGMSFLDYVARVRLTHAVSLLLRTTDSVARIAMDTGFPNLSAFNKVFRDAYHMTPSAFRQQNRAEAVQDDLPTELAPPQEAPSPTAPAPTAAPKEERNRIFRAVSILGCEPVPLKSGWNEMINIGTAADLLRADVQQQVLLLRNQLHFRYIRFWDLYAPEMLLNAPDADGRYSFQRLNKVLDFLVHNDLRPYIELADKPRRTTLGARDLMANIPQRNSFFQKEEDFYAFLHQLAHALRLRYGPEVLSSWFFEYWKTEPALPIVNDEPNIRAYLDRFDQVAAILRKELPGARVGGGGFSLRYGEENLRRTIALWAEHPQQPYFVSLYCYPTMDRSEKTAVIENQLVNPNSIRRSLELLHSALAESHLQYQQVHVTEWNISVVNRSMLNDSYFKGAYVVKNLLDSMGLADLYGYWLATDLYSEGTDCPDPLFGGCGLITRDSIPKPSWYALEFLSALGSAVYQRGSNYIVTRSTEGSWRILCHNFKHFNYQYYLYEDEQLHVQQLDTLLADTSVLELSFELPAEDGQRFRLKCSRVGRDCGSVQDLWQKMGCHQLDPAELADLARSSSPGITLETLQEHSGAVHLNATLEHNEILLMVLTPLED